MADVKSLKDKGIPLKIDGATRFVKGATKYTTCADVIKMVLKKTGIGKEYRHLFAIYELTTDGERALSGKARMLKIAKEWGGDRNKFALRKVNPLDTVVTETKPKSSSQTPKTKVSKQPEQNIFSKLSRKFRTKTTHQAKSKKRPAEQEAVDGNSICDTISDSDSSLEDLFSGIDRTKMIEFVKFFNAMTTNGESLSRRKRAKTESTSNESLAEDTRRRNTQLKSCRRLSRRKPSHNRVKTKRRTLRDVHPSKIHSVQRLDYGFIDNASVMDKIQNIASNSDSDDYKTHLESNFQRNRFRVKRYLRQNNGQANEIKNLASEKVEKALGGVYGNNVGIEAFKLTSRETDSNSKCLEIWHEDFKRENDSAPESLSSDDSTDRDSVLAYFDCVVADDAEMFLGDDHAVNKLVDYSITDSETDTDEELFDTNEMDIGYTTADTSSNGSCSSPQSEAMGTSCFIYGYHDNKAFSSESEYDVTSCSKSGMCNEKNYVDVVNTSDYIRAVFSKAHVQTEDEEMDSFMQSKIFDDSLDDGLSWIQSDSETDIQL